MPPTSPKLALQLISKSQECTIRSSHPHLHSTGHLPEVQSQGSHHQGERQCNCTCATLYTILAMQLLPLPQQQQQQLAKKAQPCMTAGQ
jgi:hypothetical protein